MDFRFGSQYTQLIARRVRELGVYCEIFPCTNSVPEAIPEHLVGLVLSGGPASVFGDDAPFDTNWLAVNKPVLGICYGMQTLAHEGEGLFSEGILESMAPET